MNFNNPVIATRMRDVIEEIATIVVERLRPAEKYAVVSSVDHPSNRAMVTYPGEEVPVPVRMDVLRPSAAGAVVRISGKTGDRYISSVVQGDWIMHEYT